MSLESKVDKIQKVVSFFTSKYAEQIVLNDEWPDDPSAVGVSDKDLNYLAYISVEDNSELFYLALEELTLDEEIPYKSAGDYNDINKLELEMRIITFFRIGLEDDSHE